MSWRLMFYTVQHAISILRYTRAYMTDDTQVDRSCAACTAVSRLCRDWSGNAVDRGSWQMPATNCDKRFISSLESNNATSLCLWTHPILFPFSLVILSPLLLVILMSSSHLLDGHHVLLQRSPAYSRLTLRVESPTPKS